MGRHSGSPALPSYVHLLADAWLETCWKYFSPTNFTSCVLSPSRRCIRPSFSDLGFESVGQFPATGIFPTTISQYLFVGRPKRVQRAEVVYCFILYIFPSTSQVLNPYPGPSGALPRNFFPLQFLCFLLSGPWSIIFASRGTSRFTQLPLFFLPLKSDGLNHETYQFPFPLILDRASELSCPPFFVPMSRSRYLKPFSLRPRVFFDGKHTPHIRVCYRILTFLRVNIHLRHRLLVLSISLTLLDALNFFRGVCFVQSVRSSSRCAVHAFFPYPVMGRGVFSAVGQPPPSCSSV